MELFNLELHKSYLHTILHKVQAREQIFLIAIFCSQHSFNVPTNIKITFINFLYDPLPPHIANREAIQNRSVLE